MEKNEGGGQEQNENVPHRFLLGLRLCRRRLTWAWLRLRRRGVRVGSLAVDLVGVLEGGGDGLEVGLDGLGPGLDVAELLEGAVESVDQLEPGLRLRREVCGVRVELLGLGVQALLVQVSLRQIIKI